jgi:PIN domain nuclease of toxin-antitoxin system
MRATLLDTCSLLWWTVDQQRLSPKAKELCGQIEDSTGYVSAVSIWEIGIKIRNKKIDIGMPFERYVDKISEISLWIGFIATQQTASS